MFGWFKREDKTNKEIAIEKFKKAGLTFEEADYLAQDIAELSLYADNKLFSNEEDNVHSIEEAYKDKYYMDTVDTIIKDKLPIKDIAYTGIQARAIGLTFENRTSLKHAVFNYLKKSGLNNSNFRESYMQALEAMNSKDDNAWMQHLWNWADENDISDIEQIDNSDYKENSNKKGIPRNKNELLSLDKLIIYENHLVSLPKEIGNLMSLTSIHVIKTNLYDVPEEIGNLNKLTTLEFTNNRLKDFPKEIRELTNLATLDFSDNEFEELPFGITDIINLESLHFYGNQLKELPRNINKLINLKILGLSENKLEELPLTIGELINLEYLLLMDNNLINVVEEIGLLQNLLSLNLNNNYLKILPKEIGNLKALKRLYLSNNHLTELPCEICNLVSLTEVSLERNKLKSLPVGIGNLSQLTALGLEGNELTSLPKQIGRLTNLAMLSLGENNLTVIPKEICDLIELTRLNFEKNKLKELPDEICNLRKLKVLGLKDNPLSLTVKQKNWINQLINDGCDVSLDDDVLEEDKSIENLKKLEEKNTFTFDNGRSIVGIPGKKSILIESLHAIMYIFLAKKLYIQKIFNDIENIETDIHFSIIGQKYLDYFGSEDSVKKAKTIYEREGSIGVFNSEINVQPKLYIEWRFDFYQNDICLEAMLFKNNIRTELYHRTLKNGPSELFDVYKIFIENGYKEAFKIIDDPEDKNDNSMAAK